MLAHNGDDRNKEADKIEEGDSGDEGEDNQEVMEDQEIKELQEQVLAEEGEEGMPPKVTYM